MRMRKLKKHALTACEYLAVAMMVVSLLLELI